MTEKRLKIGVLFYFETRWMGGIIYILNLIRILNFLDDKDKPEITLFYRPGLKKFADQIEYPYLTKIPWNFPAAPKGYLLSWILGKNLYVKEILDKYKLDGLYPLNDFPAKTKTDVKLVSWYPDLQHKYYPEFFSRKKLIERAIRIKFILKNTEDLVVSSNAVGDDFKKFFKIRPGIKMHTFHFASVIEDFSMLDVEEVKKKYQLPEKYFIISNQFHKHKNHRVLLKALILLNNKGKKIHMAMTGEFPDPSTSEYMKELHSLINDNNLEPQISFLGIIPRNEQLLLMKYSQAVIQPSLFEGWSTVIEDAISMQVPIIPASLPVNIEQLGPDHVYFDPEDVEKLAEILQNYPERNLDDIFYQEYNERVQTAAKTFINIFK